MVLERRETPEWRNAMNWIERLWRAAQSRKPKARKYCARDFLVPVLCIPTEDGWWATLSLWRALVFRADPESTIYCPLSPVPCSPPQMPSSNLLFAWLWLEPRTPLGACLVYLLNFPNLELFCFRNLLLFPRFSLKFVPKNVSRDNLSYWITLCNQHKLSSQCFWDQVTFTYFVKVFLFKA